MVKEIVGICFKERTIQYNTIHIYAIYETVYFFNVAEGGAYIYPWALKD